MGIEHLFFVSLGSNLGDRTQHLKNALAMMEERGCKISATSPIYETPALGMGEAPKFLNCCAKGFTDLEISDLMKMIHSVEQDNGRIRESFGIGSRTLDIDLIFYDDLVISSYDISVPHPRYHLRKFVLLPLIDLEPDLVDPKNKKRILDLLEECPDRSTVKKLEISSFT